MRWWPLWCLWAIGCGGDACPSGGPVFTDDPEIHRQWFVESLNAPEVWAEVPETPLLVAVVDNGFQLEHEDLRGAWWRNEGEIENNGIDDDDNGFVDDVSGWNFLEGSADVAATAADALGHHGTAVAGIVAARSNNQLGVAGLCPSCRLLPIVARDFREVRTVLPLLREAVEYASSAGAKVMVISDGRLAEQLTAAEIAEVEAAMERASELDLTVVASAGNDGDSTTRTPARIPSVIAVGATTPLGARSDFTSHGAEVDIYAPGECVFTTVLDGYDWFSGTSAAAPIVGALAALLRAKHPDWSTHEVRDRIVSTALPRADFARTLSD